MVIVVVPFSHRYYKYTKRKYTKIQIHKYANIQIHKYTNTQIQGDTEESKRILGGGLVIVVVPFSHRGDTLSHPNSPILTFSFSKTHFILLGEP